MFTFSLLLNKLAFRIHRKIYAIWFESKHGFYVHFPCRNSGILIISIPNIFMYLYLRLNFILYSLQSHQDNFIDICNIFCVNFFPSIISVQLAVTQLVHLKSSTVNFLLLNLRISMEFKFDKLTGSILEVFVHCCWRFDFSFRKKSLLIKEPAQRHWLWKLNDKYK